MDGFRIQDLRCIRCIPRSALGMHCMDVFHVQDPGSIAWLYFTVIFLGLDVVIPSFSSRDEMEYSTFSSRDASQVELSGNLVIVDDLPLTH